jgi:hypothetical protein
VGQPFLRFGVPIIVHRQVFCNREKYVFFVRKLRKKKKDWRVVEFAKLFPAKVFRRKFKVGLSSPMCKANGYAGVCQWQKFLGLKKDRAVSDYPSQVSFSTCGTFIHKEHDSIQSKE